MSNAVQSLIRDGHVVLVDAADTVERVVLGWLDEADDWDAGVDWTEVSHEFGDDT